jgi:hypothetical protein
MPVNDIKFPSPSDSDGCLFGIATAAYAVFLVVFVLVACLA